MNFTPKILIAEPEDFSEEAVNHLRQFAEVTLKPVRESELKDHLAKYDVLWMRLGFRIDEKAFGENARCRIIVSPVTGTDHIDEEFCKSRGIEIISLRGESEFLKEIRATAELTVGMAIALMRNAIPAYSSVMKGEWDRDIFRGNEIYEKTVGIAGMGRLGKITAGYFKAFGADVIGYDTREDFPEDIKRVDSLKELVELSDIISIHLSYTKDTEDIFDEEMFSYFKKDAFLINTSRGGVINESALLDALTEGRIKGAAVDVIKDEKGFTKDNPLIKYASENRNLLILPHIGGNTYESFAKTEMFIAKKLVEKMESIF